jgi:solute:Na+ symporter, SSS family
VASLATPPPSEANTRDLTYGSIHHDAAAEISASWDFGNKLMAALIVACVLGMYLYFTFWL